MKRIDFDNGNPAQGAAYRGAHAFAPVMPRREIPRVNPT
jgi:hypothetical protein